MEVLTVNIHRIQVRQPERCFGILYVCGEFSHSMEDVDRAIVRHGQSEIPFMLLKSSPMLGWHAQRVDMS